MYVHITLNTGEQYISEFTKLRSLQKYLLAVFSNRQVMNVWRITANTHPASGEPCLIRSRIIIPASAIASVMQVTPKSGLEEPDQHGYNPLNFEPHLTIQKGKGGIHVFHDNEDLPSLAVPGIEYPVHRDPDGRRYVILAAADAEENVAEERYIILPTVSSAWVPADDDDENE